mmetsp:Transcript_11023/g.18803  ORF Transcript_11023/g.18803 Transcript_11023/m.18803 type:complete len:243 (-) Transcript_11023:660-1388(-)
MDGSRQRDGVECGHGSKVAEVWSRHDDGAERAKQGVGAGDHPLPRLGRLDRTAKWANHVGDGHMETILAPGLELLPCRHRSDGRRGVPARARGDALAPGVDRRADRFVPWLELDRRAAVVDADGAHGEARPQHALHYAAALTLERHRGGVPLHRRRHLLPWRWSRLHPLERRVGVWVVRRRVSTHSLLEFSARDDVEDRHVVRARREQPMAGGEGRLGRKRLAHAAHHEMEDVGRRQLADGS